MWLSSAADAVSSKLEGSPWASHHTFQLPIHQLVILFVFAGMASILSLDTGVVKRLAFCYPYPGGILAIKIVQSGASTNGSMKELRS